MLTYGMEPATRIVTYITKLNSFHAQCIRKILNIKATYYTEVLDPTVETINNTRVLAKANITSLSNIILSRQFKIIWTHFASPNE